MEPVRLSVIIPAFDEEEAIRSVIHNVRDALQNWPEIWELLIIDDASSDRTADIALAEGVRVISRAERGGYGAAIKTGIRAARGEWVAMLDADGTYDATALNDLLPLLPRYDQVNGSRQYQMREIGWLRWFTKESIRMLAQWISGKRILDLNTGFKIFKRGLALDCLWTMSDGFSASTSLTLAFLCSGYLVAYVPISYHMRTGKSKFRPIADTLWYISTIIRLVLYFRPLRIFLPLTGLISAVCIPVALSHAIYSPSGLHDADVMCFSVAMSTLASGLLAELIVSQRRGCCIP